MNFWLQSRFEVSFSRILMRYRAEVENEVIRTL